MQSHDFTPEANGTGVPPIVESKMPRPRTGAEDMAYRNLYGLYARAGLPMPESLYPTPVQCGNILDLLPQIPEIKRPDMEQFTDITLFDTSQVQESAGEAGMYGCTPDTDTNSLTPLSTCGSGAEECDSSDDRSVNDSEGHVSQESALSRLIGPRHLRNLSDSAGKYTSSKVSLLRPRSRSVGRLKPSEPSDRPNSFWLSRIPSLFSMSSCQSARADAQGGTP